MIKKIINKKFYIYVIIFFAVFFIGQTVFAQEKVVQSASEYDYPPFSIVTEDGEADGFAVELLRAALKAVGRDVNFYVGPWAEIKEDLAAGKIQVLPLVGRTPERELIYDFTVPYITLYGNIFVRKDNISIKTISDLAGKEVIVMKGDNAEEFALRENISEHIISTESYNEAFTLLSQGKHDAIISQELVGKQIINKLRINNIVSVSQINNFKQDFTFAVKEGDIELLSYLNDGLSQVISNGEFDRLYQKWFDTGERRDELEQNTFEELSIKLRALQVAKEIELYLKEHPEMTVMDLQKDPRFNNIAVQPVGKTGYTAVTDYNTLTCRFHSSPNIVDMDLHNLAEKLPGFWSIMSRTEGGIEAGGVYDWEETDGSIKKKYMYIALVGTKTADGVGLHVAATTYLDEYKDGQSVEELTQAKKVYRFDIEPGLRELALKEVEISKNIFNDLVKQDTETIESLLESFMEEDEYKNIFITKDRDKLFDSSQKLFNKNEEESRITHFYYIEPDGTVFLRIHNKEIFGDVADRITLAKSKENNSWGTGIELGKTAFALRVVHPYYFQDELIGYVEFGEEIDHLLGIMKEQTDHEYGVVVKKEYIDEAKWASVRQAKGLRNNYDDFADYVVIDSTDSKGSFFSNQFFNEDKIRSVDEAGSLFYQFPIGERTFISGGFALHDAGGNKVGAIVSQQDASQYFLHEASPPAITEADKEERTINLIYYFIGIVLAVFIVLFILYRLNVIKFEKNIILLLLALALVLITGLFVFNTWQTSKNIKKEAIRSVENFVKAVATSRARHIDTFLEENKKIINLTGSSALTENLLSLKSDADYEYQLKELQEKISVLKDTISEILKISFVDIEGKVIVSTDESSIDLEKKEIISSLINDAVYIKEAHWSKGFNVPAIDYALPIYGENGELVGGVVVDLDISSLFKITDDATGLGKSGEIYLVNKDGYMISPSRFKDDTFLKQEIDSANVQECFKNYETYSSKGNIEEHEKAVFNYIDYRGERVFGTHDHIMEMEWCLLSKIDEAEAFSGVANTLTRIWFFVIGVIVSLVIIGIIFNSLLTRSLKIEINKKTNEAEKNTELIKNQLKKVGEATFAKEQSLKEQQQAKIALEEKIDELEKFQKLTVNREEKMIELKKKIKELENKA